MLSEKEKKIIIIKRNIECKEEKEKKNKINRVGDEAIFHIIEIIYFFFSKCFCCVQFIQIMYSEKFGNFFFIKCYLCIEFKHFLNLLSVWMKNKWKEIDDVDWCSFSMFALINFTET